MSHFLFTQMYYQSLAKSVASVVLTMKGPAEDPVHSNSGIAVSRPHGLDVNSETISEITTVDTMLSADTSSIPDLVANYTLHTILPVESGPTHQAQDLQNFASDTIQHSTSITVDYFTESDFSGSKRSCNGINPEAVTNNNLIYGNSNEVSHTNFCDDKDDIFDQSSCCASYPSDTERENENALMHFLNDRESLAEDVLSTIISGSNYDDMLTSSILEAHNSIESAWSKHRDLRDKNGINNDIIGNHTDSTLYNYGCAPVVQHTGTSHNSIQTYLNAKPNNLVGNSNKITSPLLHHSGSTSLSATPTSTTLGNYQFTFNDHCCTNNRG